MNDRKRNLLRLAQESYQVGQSFLSENEVTFEESQWLTRVVADAIDLYLSFHIPPHDVEKYYQEE